MGVFERAIKKYEDDGLYSLFSTVSSFCASTLRSRSLDHYHRYGSLKYPVSICDRLLSLQLEDRQMDRTELRRYCNSRSLFWEFGSEQEFEITYTGDSEIPDSLQRFTGTNHVSRPFVCELNDCLLFGPNALVATSEGDIVSEPITNHPTSFKEQLRESFRELGRIRTFRLLNHASTDRTYDTVFHLVTRHPIAAGKTNPTYAHWLLEDLPKLRALAHYRDVTDNEPAVLVDSDLPEWTLEMLRMIGISDDRLVEWTDMAATVSRLVIPITRPAGSSNIEPDPESHRIVRDRLQAQAKPVDTDQFATRIFLSRQGMPYRYVTNYDEVLSLLDSFGFESYRPETLSLSEQIALFSNAEAIVGVDGSAFANIIFADNATVNVIQPGKISQNWYVLANEFDLTYRYMIGTPVETNQEPRKANVHVDTDVLRELLVEATDQ